LGDQRTRNTFALALTVLLTHAPPFAIGQEPSASASAASQVESRLQQMELQNRKLAERLEAAERRHGDEMRQLLQEISQLRKQVDANQGPSRSQPGSPANGAAAAPSARPGEAPDVGGAPDTPGGRRSPIPGSGVSGARAEKKIPLKANFGPGFELMTEDQEFQLQFHQETQLDARTFSPHGDEFARSGFVFPRVRAFFNGRLTKPIEYTLSLNRGFSGLDLLEAYVNFHYDDRFQLKVGRYMTPFNYEQFAVQNMWLLAPERSLFTSNLGLNRQLGIQLWGNLFDKHLDYAVGVFDGPRNSFEDYNEAKDVMAYLNARPFGADEDSPFKNLNVGGSFTYGEQDNPLTPRTFRTASNASNASAADLFSPPFLVLNGDAGERGQRTFWSAHIAYFYQQFSLLTDYNGAILRYASEASAATSIDIPTSGYSVAMGYFLTGETQERRTILEPKRPFRLKRGQFGPGAWEVTFRYSLLDFDRNVFDAGLADPADWTNRVWSTNLGLNWYLSRYLKVYLNWQHTEFGTPVLYHNPNLRQLTNELFWLRLQLYF